MQIQAWIHSRYRFIGVLRRFSLSSNFLFSPAETTKSIFESDSGGTIGDFLIGEMGSTENCIIDLIVVCKIKIYTKNGIRKKHDNSKVLYEMSNYRTQDEYGN